MKQQKGKLADERKGRKGEEETDNKVVTANDRSTDPIRLVTLVTDHKSRLVVVVGCAGH